MKVLITCALEGEFAPWRAIREFRSGSWGPARVYVATIGGAEIGVVLTGVGPKQAALQASRAIRSECDSLSFCVSTGLAGALRPEYRIAQVLAARSVFTEVPRADLDSQLLPSSEPLVSFAAECGASVVERFHTAERAIARVDEKHHLGRTSDAVEMESFEILREAAACGIPAVAIRAISDGLDENLPLDMNQLFTDEGQLSIPRVMGQVALHPQAIPGLVKLRQNSKQAAESLARFLDRYVAMVVERTSTLAPKATAATQ
ncbi:MAG TPA: hypothetical protein VN822_00445 [Candidatus Acidoferrales bacterium]|nr:hypothetical protein [Candidatus Acidoferrales bacterium]